jgi:hypothetical protein
VIIRHQLQFAGFGSYLRKRLLFLCGSRLANLPHLGPPDAGVTYSAGSAALKLRPHAWPSSAVNGIFSALAESATLFCTAPAGA